MRGVESAFVECGGGVDCDEALAAKGVGKEVFEVEFVVGAEGGGCVVEGCELGAVGAFVVWGGGRGAVHSCCCGCLCGWYISLGSPSNIEKIFVS